ncbi:glucose-6-phosphate isomerase [bacterium]|nr:glucose-6-phosphate isomerase [FCB group bacterium]MBL7190802.1 glucose-6-phosphate isomerase [bacterium]
MDKGLQLEIIGGNRTTRKRTPACILRIHSPGEIKLDITNIFDTPNCPSPISKDDMERIAPKAVEQLEKLKRSEGNCRDKGIPMLGWMNHPLDIKREHLDEIRNAAGSLSDKIDAFVSLGIGGSYLGIEAVFKTLTHTYQNQLPREERSKCGGCPEIYFLGQNLDPDYILDTLDMLRGKRIGVNVISKSGTTTETAVVFRILRNLMEKSFGGDASRLIIATTDEKKGALRKLAGEKGYKTFVVPDNIGGRFSVLSDVGLFGLAVMDIDIGNLISGFTAMKRRIEEKEFWQNPALLHAAARYLAYQRGKKIEVIASNSAAIYQIARWMEQLFPESEGHHGKGMWVSPSMYTEKLHANGQMVQDGERNILETFLLLEKHDNVLNIPIAPDDLDGLNFLPKADKTVNDLNRLAMEGAAYAHYLGGVPNMTITIPERDVFCIGQLICMMEYSVAISGYLLGHNPFIQPGVEAYKKAMFALAGKPGYEEEGEKIKKELDGRERIVV